MWPLFLTAFSILQKTEEGNYCDTVGHLVIVYTKKLFCNLSQMCFFKHLSSLKAKSKY